jgi:hypothetical protein
VVTGTATHWAPVRATLEETAGRFSALLRSVRDPSRRAVGEWSIGETAAHARIVSALDSVLATGIEPPGFLRPVYDKARTVSLADVAALNALTLDVEGERDTGVLASRVEEEVGRLLEATAAVHGDERVRWLGGLSSSPAGILAHLVSELLIHGRDIARAEGRSFPIPSASARLFFEAFFFEALRAPEVAGFAGGRTTGEGRVCWELRLWGSGRVAFVSDGGRLAFVEPGAHPTDLRVSADPAAMLLVLFGRVNPLYPVLRGRLRVWGRRPWRLRRLMRAIKMP